MLKTIGVLFTLLVAPIAVSAAIVGPDGVLRYPLGDRMPALRCKPLFVCDLVLEAGEQIINVAVGDSVRWLIAPASSGGADAATPHVLVKPTEAGLHTNLIVTTNRRTYYLSLVSSASNPMPRIGFLYPQDPRALGAGAQREGVAQALPQTAIDRLDFGYNINGDRGLQPLRVFNDGTHTYLEMPDALHDVPVLFAVGSDGDVLVNYRFTRRYYVVDGVPDGIALVEGSGKHQRRALVTRENR